MSEKECNECHVVKTLNSFHVSKSCKLERCNTCKECRSIKAKRNDYPRPPPGTMVYCNKCKITHDESSFSSQKSSSNGLQSICKKCQAQKQSVRNSKLLGFIAKIMKDGKRNAERRDIDFKLTIEDLIEVYDKQKGKCSISGVEMTHISNIGKECRVINKNNISLDRIDSTGIYEKSNIHLTTTHINRMCWDFDKGDFYDICSLVADRYKKGLIKC